LVNLVEDWKRLEDCSQFCRYDTYQANDVIDDLEVRVLISRFGYAKTFPDCTLMLTNTEADRPHAQ
jgi:hypothetical protein